MPNGRTHDMITVITAAAMVPAALNSSMPEMNPTNAFVLTGSYLVSGLLFSPDLDLHSAPYRRWGPLRWIWLPYQRLVPHRSWVSHSFVLGPLLRILYFLLMLSLVGTIVLGMLNLVVPVDPTGALLALTSNISNWVLTRPAWLVYALAGFVLGGAAHTLADLVFTGVKRRFRG